MKCDTKKLHLFTRALHTYRKKSTDKSRYHDDVGKPQARSTIRMVMIDDMGTPAVPMLAAVAVRLMVRSIPEIAGFSQTRPAAI